MKIARHPVLIYKIRKSKFKYMANQKTMMSIEDIESTETKDLYEDRRTSEKGTGVPSPFVKLRGAILVEKWEKRWYNARCTCKFISE